MALELSLLRGRTTAVFESAAEEVAEEPWIRRLSRYQTSDQAEEEYVGHDRAPRMTENNGAGPRSITEMGEHSIKLRNRIFDHAVSLPKHDYRRDKLGAFDGFVRDLAVSGRTHPNELAVETLLGLEAQVCKDGQFFFDTDHEYRDSGVQSNIATEVVGAGPAADPSPTQLNDALMKCVVQQFGFRDSAGRKMNPGMGARFLIKSPLALMKNFDIALNADMIVQSGGGVADNPIRKQNHATFELVPNADLDATWGDATKQFAIFREDGPGSAFVFQEEVPLTPDATGMNEYELFHHKRMLFGAERVYGMAGFDWHKAVLFKFLAS